MRPPALPYVAAQAEAAFDDLDGRPQVRARAPGVYELRHVRACAPSGYELTEEEWRAGLLELERLGLVRRAVARPGRALCDREGWRRA